MRTLIRLAAVAALALVLLPAHSQAVTLAGGDDFADDAVDAALWGADFGSGGTLAETNQRLEYTVAAAGGEALLVRPWVLSPASYDEDWQLRLDIHVANVSLPTDGQDLLFGVAIVAGDYVAGVNIELENLSGTVLRGFHAVNEGPGGDEVMVPTTTTDGAGLLAFDAATKELTYWYDEDGATGGYSWTLFRTLDLDAPGTDWGLSPGADFEIGLFGESHGIVVGSGDAFGDNFAVTVPAVHDLSLTSLKPPKRVTFAPDPPAPRPLKLSLQNQGNTAETIANQTQLDDLLDVTISSLGGCATPGHTVLPPKNGFPVVVAPNKKVSLELVVSWECINDELATTKDMDHADYTLEVNADLAALGQTDEDGSDDVCPRAPAGDDKGCGKTGGQPFRVDLVLD